MTKKELGKRISEGQKAAKARRNRSEAAKRYWEKRRQAAAVHEAHDGLDIGAELAETQKLLDTARAENVQLRDAFHKHQPAWQSTTAAQLDLIARSAVTVIECVAVMKRGLGL